MAESHIAVTPPVMKRDLLYYSNCGGFGLPLRIGFARRATYLEIILLFVLGSAACVSPSRDADRLKLCAPLVVHGTVLDAGDHPIGDAEVVMWNIQGIQSERTETKSSADGRFTIATTKPFTHIWSLVVRKDGFGPSKIDSFFAQHGQLLELDLGIVYLYPSAALRGVVKDSNGSPIQGASVFLDFENQHREFEGNTWSASGPSATTDALGQYHISNLPSGSVTMGVAAPGHGKRRRTGVSLQSNAASTIDIDLGPELVYRGCIRSDIGSPVEGVKVTMRDLHDNPWGAEVASSHSDASGRFEIRGVAAPSGKRTLEIKKVGFMPVCVSDEQLQLENDYQLTKTTTLAIRATRQGSNDLPAIQYTSWMFSDKDGEWGGGGPSSFEFPAPNIQHASLTDPAAEGIRIFVVSKDGEGVSCGRVEIPKPVGGTLTIDAVFPKPATVSGIVTSAAGVPVRDARVRLRSSQGWQGRIDITDELGRYRFESVHPEEMAVECSGMNWWSELKEIDVSPGETTHMPIVASKTCTIRGRVTVDGKPPGKPIVVRAYRYVAEQNRLTPKEEYGLGRASMGSMLAIGATEADGTFTFVGLRRDQSPNDRIILDPARPQIADGKSIQFGWLDSAWQSEAAENRNKPWPWIVAVDPDRPAFAECNLSTVK